MGNQLFTNYEVEKEPTCFGGQNGIWKIYSATKLDSTKRKVSIWMFDKKNITDKAVKAAREEIAAFLKKEATSMMKIRHPNIVNLVEPVLEDKNSMAFVTERVDDNLYNLMKKNDFNAICNSELDLKLQVENILKVLQFLHYDVKMAHLGICPENIFIVNGQWKVSGFTFSTTVQQSQTSVEAQNVDFTKRPFDHFCQFFPNLSFSAPEVAETPSKCSFASDIFSLALLILFMYQIKNQKSTQVKPILNAKYAGEYSAALQQIQGQFKSASYIQKDLTEDFRGLISKMLAKNTATRPTIEQIKQSSWMNDPFVKAIYMLENIVELEQNKQISFLTGISSILFKYEVPVIKKRIVPSLLELSKFEYLIPSVLQVVTDCLKQPDLYSVSEFQAQLSEFIIGLTKRKSIPGKALYSLVVNCETYFKFFDKNEFQNVYLVPVLKCFDIPQLQGFALSQSDFLIGKLEYAYTKAKILPKILSLCTSPTPKIMKQSILTLKKIIPNLDKHILNDQVLATLDKLRRMTVADKSITMLILEIYQLIAKSLDILVIAQKILPGLIPYLIDQSLGKKEFDAYLGAVNSMIKQIEIERRKSISDTEGHSIESTSQNAPPNAQGISNNDEDLFQFENKPVQTTPAKQFDFLSMFDEKPATSTTDQNRTSAGPQATSVNQAADNNTGNKKPISTLQMDFNFDMFDNVPALGAGGSASDIQPSNPINEQKGYSNDANNKQPQSRVPAPGFEPQTYSQTSSNFFNIQNNNNNNSQNSYNNEVKMEYKDPFANQKAPPAKPQPSVSASNNNSDLFGNQQKKQVKDPVSTLDMDLFANYKSPNNPTQQSFLNTQPVSQQPVSSGWDMGNDLFSNNISSMGGNGGNSKFSAFDALSQTQNNPMMGNNNNNSQGGMSSLYSTSGQTNLFDNPVPQQNSITLANGSSLFNNLKKNNNTTSAQKSTNLIDDLFGAPPSNPNQLFQSSTSGSGNFDLL